MTPRVFNWLDIVRREWATVTVLKIAAERSWEDVPIMINSDLSAFSSKSFSANHDFTSHVHASSLSRSACEVDERMARNSCGSSEYWWWPTPWLDMTRLSGDMYAANVIDPRTNPCWTPKVQLTVNTSEQKKLICKVINSLKVPLSQV